MTDIPSNSLARVAQTAALGGDTSDVTQIAEAQAYSRDAAGNVSGNSFLSATAAIDPTGLVQLLQLQAATQWAAALVSADETLDAGDKKVVDTSGGDVTVTIPTPITTGNSFELHNQGAGNLIIDSSTHDITQLGVVVADPILINGQTILLVATSATTLEIVSIVSTAADVAGGVTELWTGAISAGTATLSSGMSNFDMIVIEGKTPSDSLRGTTTILVPTAARVYSITAGSTGTSQGAVNITMTNDTTLTVASSTEGMQLVAVYGIKLNS